jgi:hypothetical protein
MFYLTQPLSLSRGAYISDYLSFTPFSLRRKGKGDEVKSTIFTPLNIFFK